jgi:hypothetical protein
VLECHYGALVASCCLPNGCTIWLWGCAHGASMLLVQPNLSAWPALAQTLLDLLASQSKSNLPPLSPDATCPGLQAWPNRAATQIFLILLRLLLLLGELMQLHTVCRSYAHTHSCCCLSCLSRSKNCLLAPTCSAPFARKGSCVCMQWTPHMPPNIARF